MCTITATEFKENFGKYLELGRKEDILVTKNGKPLVRIVSAKRSSSWEEFFDKYEGIIKEEDLKTFSLEEIEDALAHINVGA